MRRTKRDIPPESLLEEPVVIDLLNLNPRIAYVGLQDSAGNGGIFECVVPRNELRSYQDIFLKYLGRPRKTFKKPVEVDVTVPAEYIPYLNRMHGFLLLGIAFREHLISLDGIVDVGVSQQGGFRNPPINLFNAQSFYGKIHGEHEKVEIARLCPHLGTGNSQTTVEYMVYHPKH